MFKPISLLLFSALIACGLPTELDQPWRGNPLDEQADPEAVDPQTGSGSTDGGMGTSADGGEAPETCGNGELDPGEDCDETVEGSDFPCTTQCRFIDCGDGGGIVVWDRV